MKSSSSNPPPAVAGLTVRVASGCGISPAVGILLDAQRTTRGRRAQLTARRPGPPTTRRYDGPRARSLLTLPPSSIAPRSPACPALAARLGFGLPAAIVVLAAGLAGFLLPALAQPTRPIVYVIPIDGVIDLGLAPFVDRTLKEAGENGAAAVVLEIDTFGGRVDAAVVIRDALLRSRVKTIAFVNKRAISAGALIALAANTIVMAEGGTIGAATPVTMAPGGSAEPVAEKTVSYMRTEFRSTAEARGRPPDLAEAMVDADIEVKGISEKGKLLTLTTAQALEHKVADLGADSLEALLAAVDLEDAEVRRPRQTWAEGVVRAITNPIVSSILMAVGVLGIIIEIQTPGVGLPGAVGILSLGLFFGGHWIVMLAGWEELLLVAAGLVLLGIEVFVTPGFGAAGILGTLALVGGLGLSMVGAGAAWEMVVIAAGRVAASLLLALAGAVAMAGALPRLRLILKEALTASEGYASPPASDSRWLGRHGTAISTLRPAGIADLDGERVDVVSEGTFIDAGEPIDVIHVDGNRIVVRRTRAGQTEGSGHGS
ncbi:MAG: nodulation protein NfeD [Acidobacteria bacterium]|nr:nodulation protein NfeD [Acidobacteriota bacterium]